MNSVCSYYPYFNFKILTFLKEKHQTLKQRSRSQTCPPRPTNLARKFRGVSIEPAAEACKLKIPLHLARKKDIIKISLF